MMNLSNCLNKYEVVFVDIDNTLYNYTYAHNCALKITLNQYNFNIDNYNYAKALIKSRGLIVNHHKKELYFKIMCEVSKKKFNIAYDMYNTYMYYFLSNIKIDKSMKEYLEYCQDKGIKVVAITDFYFFEQVRKLKKTNLDKYIDYIVTSEEFEEEKPSFRLVERALELVNNCEKSKIVMIGDSENDNLLKYGIDYYPYNCSRLLISISGKSGVGKSTLTGVIKNILDAEVICGDGYHKYDRYSEEWLRLTHYNPNANNLIQLACDIKSIYYGKNKLNIPLYDHNKGLLGSYKTLSLNYCDVVIIEGLHTLYPEVTGDFIKIKIYIESDVADLQKINRDVRERHKEKNSVLDNIINREIDYATFIKNQKYNANFVISVKNSKFFIELKDLLKVDWMPNSFNGKYEDLLPTIKFIFNSLKSHRWENA